jgi:hypothetical protein
MTTVAIFSDCFFMTILMTGYAFGLQAKKRIFFRFIFLIFHELWLMAICALSLRMFAVQFKSGFSMVKIGRREPDNLKSAAMVIAVA